MNTPALTLARRKSLMLIPVYSMLVVFAAITLIRWATSKNFSPRSVSATRS
jgi:hypothetical protein